MHNIKTTVPITTKVCKAMKTTNNLQEWSKHVQNKSKMADGGHLEK